jgi:putative serine protease PepD
VSAQGHSYIFPAGTTVRIGSAPDSDVVLSAPTVGARHARLVPDGDAWRLVDDEVSGGIWAGGWVSSLRVAGEVTALLGNREGTTELRFQLLFEPSAVAAGTPAQRLAAAPTERLVTERLQPPGQPLPAQPDEPPRAPPPPAQPPPPAHAPPPQAAQAQAAQAQAAQAQAVPPGVPVLVTRLGGVQRIFPVGTRVRVGRDPALELVSVNPLVSRECHGAITSDAEGATYTDQSRRGTFLNGKRLRGSLRITESVLLLLGDPATGEELGITPPLSSARLERNRGKRVRSGRVRLMALIAAAVVVAAGVVTGVLVGTSRTPAPTPSPTGATLSGGLSAAVLQHAETATVRLLIGSQSNYTGWGSGTLISPNGLILTNAHVAEPQAPGAAVAMGLPATQLGPDPAYLTVEVTTGPASPVVARYRAKPVAVDGYLDFAVVQIYATADGTPVNPDTLHLPYFALGNDAAVQLDQPVTVLGFPGVADSDSISVTTGVVSTFVPDPLGHVSDPRFELETTARVAHGNSGGAAINNAGQLIGVPSLEITGEGADVSWRLRSVAEAMPLITAARDHTAYHSKVLVQLTGHEQVGAGGVGASAQEACSGDRSTPSAATAMFGATYAQFPVGLDVAILIVVPGGTAVTSDYGGLPQTTVTKSSGCLSYELAAAQLGQAVLTAGRYQLQLLGGPELTPLGPAASLTVGSPTAATPSP